MPADNPVRVAIDVGSSGGKMHFAWREGDDIHFEEAHRFEAIHTEKNGRVVWNIDHIVEEIGEGLRRIENDTDRIDSIGIDATALGFGFVKDGELLGDPYFYLDQSLYSMESEIRQLISQREVFEHTGHPSLPNPYYYQCQNHPEMVKEADEIITIPGILSSKLGASPTCEETYAMTLYIFEARGREWADELVEKLNLPTELLPETVSPGEKIGAVGPTYVDELESNPDIVLPPGHDTASAMAALPLIDGNRTFLATGSWFIPGLELPEPVVTDAAFEANVSNELSVDGKIRFLRNMPGFSLLEHCREKWKAAGERYEYDDLLSAVAESEPYGPLIDPLDDLFFQAQRTGEVIEAIEQYCNQTGQNPPETKGEITRCLLESLAARSAVVIETLNNIVSGQVNQIHLCGGGVRNEQFCEMVASASGHPVKSGPIEATAIGNALAQMISGGEIKSHTEARRLINSNIDFDLYKPHNRREWSKAMDRFQELIN
jgi:rhamnulokinase